jgi:phosphomannomutase
VGLAFDGDADRVFLVDERAEGVSGSEVTALVARSMLKHHPGSSVVYNLICSWMVPEVIREAGGTPVRTRVGHSFIKQVMAETGAVFGGEHSGHYYFRDNYRADSGLIAAVVVLEQLSPNAPLSVLAVPPLPGVRRDQLPGRPGARSSHRWAFGAARPPTTDVEFADSWFNVGPQHRTAAATERRARPRSS